jgi:hypothetical protein
MLLLLLLLLLLQKLLLLLLPGRLRGLHLVLKLVREGLLIIGLRCRDHARHLIRGHPAHLLCLSQLTLLHHFIRGLLSIGLNMCELLIALGLVAFLEVGVSRRALARRSESELTLSTASMNALASICREKLTASLRSMPGLNSLSDDTLCGETSRFSIGCRATMTSPGEDNPRLVGERSDRLTVGEHS